MQSYNEARKIRDEQDAYCGRVLDGKWDLVEDKSFPEDLQWEALVDVLRGRVKVCSNIFLWWHLNREYFRRSWCIVMNLLIWMRSFGCGFSPHNRYRASTDSTMNVIFSFQTSLNSLSPLFTMRMKPISFQMF